MFLHHKHENNYKVALCLSGGAARGVTHVGVLRVLYNEWIPIDVMVGSSAGSLISCLYALHGYHRGWELFQSVTHRVSIFKQSFSKDEIFSSDHYKEFLFELFGDATFEDLNIPVVVTALDLDSGQTVYLKDGLLRDAIYASCAIPGVWKPAKINGMTLVDGSFANDIPVEWMRKQGADIVIVSAVNIYNNLVYRKRNFLEEVAYRAISGSGKLLFTKVLGSVPNYFMEKMKGKEDLFLVPVLKSLVHLAKNFDKQKWGADADIVIAPPLKEFYSLDTVSLKRVSSIKFITAGAIGAWEKIFDIKAVLEEAKIERMMLENIEESRFYLMA